MTKLKAPAYIKLTGYQLMDIHNCSRDDYVQCGRDCIELYCAIETKELLNANK